MSVTKSDRGGARKISPDRPPIIRSANSRAGSIRYGVVTEFSDAFASCTWKADSIHFSLSDPNAAASPRVRLRSRLGLNPAQIVERLASDQRFSSHVTAWRVAEPRAARYGMLPDGIDPSLVQALRRVGIDRPYSHQAEAAEKALRGEDVVVVTGTASGKTLCYNLPVVQAILDNSESRALYLFPTKALSQDQLDELHGLVEATEADIKTFTYDGDTPTQARRAVRRAGHIVVTNPDMLHTGILPHHTNWTRLFENLRYIVIDELHYYRGVFGSHLANVLRRLLRICEFYGSRPSFICSSATIANPEELARRLTGRNFTVVDDDGSPRGERHYILYNPAVVNRELGLRRSTIDESAELAGMFLGNDIQTLAFARSRVDTEVLLTKLQSDPALAGFESAATGEDICPRNAGRSNGVCGPEKSGGSWPPTRLSSEST